MFFYNEQPAGIVTDGLTFNIDPSDPQSYSGGSIIYDTVNNHSSQLHGGVTIEQTNNGILSFDGIDDYLNFGSFMTLSTFTIVMAVKPGNTQVEHADIFDNNHTSFQNFVFQQHGLNTNYYSAGVTVGVDITLDPSKWQIVTMVFINQNKLAVYKDDL